ncbi:MAG: CBS domain-containing protein, partial [Ardenticatenaceae bacterium]
NRDVRQALNSPLVNHILEQKEFIDDFTAGSCMTPNPRTVTPDTPAAKVAEMLALYKYGALPVVDERTLVGIITVTDMLNYMAQALKA